MNLRDAIAAIALLTGAVGSCSNGVAPNPASRTYRLGFSATPPRLTVESVIQTITTWEPHADIALINQGVPTSRYSITDLECR